MRPPEPLQIFDHVGNYYHWFCISKKVNKSDKLDNKLNIDMKESYFIDSLKCQVYLRIETIQEVVEYSNFLDLPEE